MDVDPNHTTNKQKDDDGELSMETDEFPFPTSQSVDDTVQEVKVSHFKAKINLIEKGIPAIFLSSAQLDKQAESYDLQEMGRNESFLLHLNGFPNHVTKSEVQDLASKNQLRLMKLI